METPIKMDDLGVALFQETPMVKANHRGSVMFCRYKKRALTWGEFHVTFGTAWCKNYRQAQLPMGKVTPILNVTVLCTHG